MARTRFTLRYKDAQGIPRRLFNLYDVAVNQISAAQRHLGSTDFEAFAQEHHYSQQEMDLIRTREGD